MDAAWLAYVRGLERAGLDCRGSGPVEKSLFEFVQGFTTTAILPAKPPKAGFHQLKFIV